MLRVARLVRFVRALRVLVHSITSTAKSLVWVLLLVFLVVYLFALIFTQAAKAHLETYSANAVPSDSRDDLALKWGSLLRSMLTLYKCMTNGLDWEEALHPLDELGAMWQSVLCLYIAFVNFTLLNVVTGVFCQSAIQEAQHDNDLFVHDLLASRQLDIKNACQLFSGCFEDIAKGGSSVSLETFQEHLSNRSVQAYFALLDMDATDAFALFKLLDREGNNSIKAVEFVEGCLRLRGSARSLDLMKLTYETRFLMKEFARFEDETERQLRDLHGCHHRTFVLGTERPVHDGAQSNSASVRASQTSARSSTSNFSIPGGMDSNYVLGANKKPAQKCRDGIYGTIEL